MSLLGQADYITHPQSDLSVSPVSDLSGLLLLFVYFTSLETGTDNTSVFRVQRFDTFHSLPHPLSAAQERAFVPGKPGRRGF